MIKLKNILKETKIWGIVSPSAIGSLKDEKKYISTPIKEKFLQDEENEPKYTKEDLTKFNEAVTNFNKFGDSIYREHKLSEITDIVKSVVEMANHVAVNEGEEWFDKMTVGKDMKRMAEAVKVFEKTAKEVGVLQHRLESAYEDIGSGLNKYFTINEDKPTPNE